MPNRHHKKWRIYVPAGFLMLATGIFAVYYSVFRADPSRWIAWYLVSFFLLAGSLALLGSGLLHKIKSDLIRKQKSREKREEEQS